MQAKGSNLTSYFRNNIEEARFIIHGNTSVRNNCGNSKNREVLKNLA